MAHRNQSDAGARIVSRSAGTASLLKEAARALLDRPCRSLANIISDEGPCSFRYPPSPRPSCRWHLDEMVVRIAGKRMYLWRAVDHEGEILDILVQRRRDKRAALRLMRKLLRKQGFAPRLVVTDKLRPRREH